MASAQLPDLPKGEEFEEFVAAYLQSSGLYVERRIVDRREAEVLELDIVTTKYEADQGPISKIVEVNSGDWGAGDVFKVRGWLDYLALKQGALVVAKQVQQLAVYAQVAHELGLDLISIPDLKNAAAPLAALTEVKPDPDDVWAWRFSYWVERQLLRYLMQRKKSAGDNKKCYRALAEYLLLINSRIFFSRNVVRRAVDLYSAFSENAHISAKLAHELHGEDFDDEHETVPDAFFKRAYYACELNELAISTYAEYRALLAVLKAATDYVLFKRQGSDHNEAYTIKLEDFELEVGGTLLQLVPASFRKGLDAISREPYFHRYPIV